MINFIYASDEEGLIGVGNRLPWNDLEELNHFKEVTKGHVVIMGYRTWESIDKTPLPHRRNLILVTDKHQHRLTDIGDIIKSVTVDEVVSASMERPHIRYFVIGGATTFKLFEPYVNGCIYHSVLTDDSVLDESLMAKNDKYYYIPSETLRKRMELREQLNLKHFRVDIYNVEAK